MLHNRMFFFFSFLQHVYELIKQTKKVLTVNSYLCLLKQLTEIEKLHRREH